MPKKLDLLPPGKKITPNLSVEGCPIVSSWLGTRLARYITVQLHILSDARQTRESVYLKESVSSICPWLTGGLATPQPDRLEARTPVLQRKPQLSLNLCFRQAILASYPSFGKPSRQLF